MSRGQPTETPQQRDPAVTIYERSRPGRRAFVAPEAGVPERPLDELIPARLRRAEPAKLPEIAEPEIVRHYNRISKRNFDLDTGFYPLGADYPEYADCLLVAVTEQRTREDIDRLASVLEGAVSGSGRFRRAEVTA